MRVSLWPFFGLIFGLSWLFWVPATLFHATEPAFPILELHYLGGLMPPVVAIALLHLQHTRAEQRDYWQRVVDFKRIRLGWYAVILLTPSAFTALSALCDRLLGGRGAVLNAASSFMHQPVGIVRFAMSTLLFGPLPEELAWRGYALDRLQMRWNTLMSSLMLEGVWTVWHLPLFFIKGSYQHGLGVGTLGFWLFMMDKVPQSIIMT